MDNNIGSAFLETLLTTERMPEDEIVAHQADLLSRLYHHAVTEVEVYRHRPPPPLSLDPTSLFWRDQPFVTRDQLAAGLDLFCARNVPENHGGFVRWNSGGSTGRAVSRLATSLESLARTIAFYRALGAWHYDYSNPLLLIRTDEFAKHFDDMVDKGDSNSCWQLPAYFGHKDPAAQQFLNIRSAPSEQLAKIIEVAPANINTFPSNLLRLALEARRHDPQPIIPIVISVAEYLAPEIRILTERTFGSRIIDVLSSAEAGIIAIQCPYSSLYHIQSELVLVEIIGVNGKLCRTGEIGELVVTPLYNYASPLLRYRTGDYVECGPQCPCGRTLPTISKFVGRREHMFNFPDGRDALPNIDRIRITELIGHDAWAFVQTEKRRSELRVARFCHTQFADQLTSLLKECTGGNFEVEIVSVDELPLTAGAKRHFTLNAYRRSGVSPSVG
ncbi:MAG: hypothetical protein U1E67_21730 [Hyphomicrobiales bacterium]